MMSQAEVVALRVSPRPIFGGGTPSNVLDKLCTMVFCNSIFLRDTKLHEVDSNRLLPLEVAPT